MGTHGLLRHIIRGKKKAAYNFPDSEPDSQGSAVCTFIHSLSEEQITQMIQNLEKVKWVKKSVGPDEEKQARYIASGFADLAVSRQTASDWSCLLYNVQGAKALPHILDGSLVHLVDSTDFERDTLCKWAYFVDWENKLFTIENWDRNLQSTFDNPGIFTVVSRAV